MLSFRSRAKHPMAKADSAFYPVAARVGTAMHHRVRHGDQCALIDGATFEIDDSSDCAHDAPYASESGNTSALIRASIARPQTPPAGCL